MTVICPLVQLILGKHTKKNKLEPLIAIAVLFGIHFATARCSSLCVLQVGDSYIITEQSDPERLSSFADTYRELSLLLRVSHTGQVHAVLLT